MDKVIFCFNCAEKTSGAIRKVAEQQGKFFKVTIGEAQRKFQCDNCDAAIEIKELCAAISQANNENHYTTWETGYLNLLEP